MKPPVWERLGIPKPPGWSDTFRTPTTYAARYKRPLIFRGGFHYTPWHVVIPPAMRACGDPIATFHTTHAGAIAYAHQFATDWHAHKETEPCS